jgi:hypothetical protein
MDNGSSGWQGTWLQYGGWAGAALMEVNIRWIARYLDPSWHLP